MKSVIATTTTLVRHLGPLAAAVLLALLVVLPARAETQHTFILTGNSNVAYFTDGVTVYRVMGTGPQYAFQRMITEKRGVAGNINYETGVVSYAGHEIPGIKVHPATAAGRLNGYLIDYNDDIYTFTSTYPKN